MLGVKKPALSGLLRLFLKAYFADLRRDIAKPSKPRPSRAMDAGSGTVVLVVEIWKDAVLFVKLNSAKRSCETSEA